MISDRKRAANRLNAQKSTGPRTRRGKAKMRFNASSHGYFCRDIVCQGESKKAFAAVREGLLDALNPATLAELLIVDRIVAAT